MTKGSSANKPLQTFDADAHIFKLIRICAERHDAIASLDKRVVTLQWAGHKADASLDLQLSQLIGQTHEIERLVAYVTDAQTVECHKAKVKFVKDCGFDPDDLVEIAWLLGHEAARLGLPCDVPTLTLAPSVLARGGPVRGGMKSRP